MERKKVFIFYEKAMGQWCNDFLAHRKDTIELFSFPDVKNPNTPDFLSMVKKIGPDVAFSSHCSKIFKEEIINLFPEGIINLHPSLLPRHGGFFPTMWSIIEGDTESGYTLHRIDSGIDTGPIIAQARVSITETDTGESLHKKQIAAGKELFTHYAEHIIAGNYTTRPQEGPSCYHGKGLPFGGRIPWDQTYEYIKRVIRAFRYTGFPEVMTNIDGINVEVVEIEPTLNVHLEYTGNIVRKDNEIYAQCLDKTVRVLYNIVP